MAAINTGNKIPLTPRFLLHGGKAFYCFTVRCTHMLRSNTAQQHATPRNLQQHIGFAKMYMLF